MGGLCCETLTLTLTLSLTLTQVRVLYNGRPVLRDGRETCTLDEFKRYLAPYVVHNFAQEGQPREASDAKSSSSSSSSSSGFNSERRP